jgi:hypothetical protein
MKKKINKKIEKKYDWQGWLQKIEDFLDLYLIEKAPTLPYGLKKFLVTIWPWFLLVSLIFTIPLFLMAIGLRFLVPSFLISEAEFHFSFLMVFGFITFALEVFALPSLFKREKFGWKLVFYTRLINAVAVLITLNIFSLIIGTTISLYFLFQLKEFYK